MKKITLAVSVHVVLLSLGLSSGLMLSKAHAAKRGRIISDTNLYQERNETSPILQNVKSGSPVLTSNESKGGFYKAKTKQGKIGFIRETAVSFGENARVVSRRSKSSSSSSSMSKRFRVRGFGGLDLLSASEFATLIGAPSISNGIYFGGDFEYFFSPKVFAILRGEYITKSFSVTFQSRTYNFALSSLPIMAGAGYVLSHSPKFDLEGSLLVGAGLSTTMTGTGVNDTAPNVTTYSGSAMGFLVKLDAVYNFSESFHIFAEAGYRYMKTSEVSPSPVGSDTDIYENPIVAGNNPNAVAINISGPLIAIGLGLRF